MTAPTTKLPMRPLGKNGPLVPRLGLGLMGPSGMYGKHQGDDDFVALLDEAYKMGEIFWDTAELYGSSEAIIGRWFAANPEKRSDIILASKFGVFPDPTSPSMMRLDSSVAQAEKSLAKSLDLLHTDYIDVYYVHHIDHVTPIEHTIAYLKKQVEAGKIRHIGMSECSAATLRRAHAVHPIACVQMEYNPLTLDIELPERAVLKTARELGIAVVAYSPLGRGLLTGRIKSSADLAAEKGDMRSVLPRFNKDNIEQNGRVVDKIAGIATAKGVSVPQIALAWLLKQGDDIFGIPGSSKAARLAENLNAMQVQLTDEEEKAIRQAAEGVAGARIFDLPGMEAQIAFADSAPLP